MTETEKAAEKYADKIYTEHGRCDYGCCFSEYSYEVAFLAGAAFERERAKGLVATLESISSHYGQRPDDRELARVYEDMANDALKKWRQDS